MKNRHKKVMAYIWREDIYKNNFHCACGEELFDPDGRKSENRKKTLRRGNDLYCAKCNQIAARITYVKAKTITSKLMGDYNLYLQKLQGVKIAPEMFQTETEA